MSARLVFLGRLAELVGSSELVVESGPLATILADLPDALCESRIRRALNGVVVMRDDALILADGDELAFLPPVSGG